MKGKQLFMFLLLVVLSATAGAQKIVYSEYDKDDSRRMNFEIVGKLNGNFLIYKNIRSKHWIVGLDNEMKQIFRSELISMPAEDRMINSDFFAMGDYAYMVYQYQKKGVVYCMASKIDAGGKQMGDPVQLDTTHLSFAADNKIYSVLNSEDKSKIGVFKINSRNRKLYKMTTVLFTDKLELLKKTVIDIPMEERNEDLGDFKLANDGDMVFCKFLRNFNENITDATFFIKEAQGDTLIHHSLKLEKIMLDEINVKVDNPNKRYLLSSLFYKEKRGNAEGYYFYIWDKTTGTVSLDTTHAFSEELRKEARGNSTMKTAFNDYFIRNVISKRDGGFIISAEAYYTRSRYNNWNRWDYLYGGYPYYGSQSYYYSPYYYNRYWWNSPRYNNNQAVRYHADNVIVLSFKPTSEVEWSNVLTKEQYDDESDDRISFQIMNTGGQLHFLFNQFEKRFLLLNDFTIAPDGAMTRSPTLKNLERGYEFLPKYAKQVTARQMIVPCLYRNYICFAKIDFN